MVYRSGFGFAFELPEGWRREEHNQTITFHGPQGNAGRTEQVVQLSIGGILPRFQSAAQRKAFLAEPGAEVLDGRVGDETNVAILRKATNSEISVVRDGIHYSFTHSHDSETLRAVEWMCRTATFPTLAEAQAAIEQWGNPQAQAVTRVLRAHTPEEARAALAASGATEVKIGEAITGHSLVGNSSPPVADDPFAIAGSEVNEPSPAQMLLDQLDNGSSKAEEDLVKMGDECVDDLVQSIAQINGRLNGSIKCDRVDRSNEMLRLERRVHIIRQLKHPGTLKAAFDALADSAVAVRDYRMQRDMAYDSGNPMLAMVVEPYLATAKSLNRAAVEALVAFGPQIIPQAEHYMGNSQEPVVKALHQVVSRLRPRWWQFWKQ